jgi:hypothetical protein
VIDEAVDPTVNCVGVACVITGALVGVSTKNVRAALVPPPGAGLATAMESVEAVVRPVNVNVS